MFTLESTMPILNIGRNGRNIVLGVKIETFLVIFHHRWLVFSLSPNTIQRGSVGPKVGGVLWLLTLDSSSVITPSVPFFVWGGQYATFCDWIEVGGKSLRGHLWSTRCWEFGLEFFCCSCCCCCVVGSSLALVAAHRTVDRLGFAWRRSQTRCCCCEAWSKLNAAG